MLNIAKWIMSYGIYQKWQFFNATLSQISSLFFFFLNKCQRASILGLDFILVFPDV